MADPSGTNTNPQNSVLGGGTGTSTFTSEGVLYGQGTSTLGVTAAGTTNFLLLGQGSAAAPIFQSISTAIDSAIGSTQGNLLYRNSTTWTALTPGTAGYLLQTPGASANPAWAGGMALLNTISPNNVATTADTTSLTSTYSRYMVQFENVCPANNNTIFQLQMATTGTAYVSGGYVSMATVDSAAIVSDTSTTTMLLSGTRSTTAVGNSTTYGVSGFVYITNPAATTFRKMMVGQVGYLNGTVSGTANLCVTEFAGYLDVLSANIAVQFSFSSGNIQTGTIRIYGVS